MSLAVFFAVLLAAGIHAGWNTLVKGSSDKWVSIASVVVGHVLLSVLALLILPFPSSESFPYVLVSGFIHTGYMLFLIFAYSVGDLSHVYPIARGVGPMLVTIISITFLGVVLEVGQLAGVVIVVSGILTLIFAQPLTATSRQSTLLAVGTGCFIAGYSIADGLGARVAGEYAGAPVAFFSLVCIISALTFIPILWFKKPAAVIESMRDIKLVLIAGGGSFFAYAIVVWAFTQAPIPLVTALRETSTIFALLLGVMVLGENLTLVKVIATVVTLVGAVLMKVG